MNFKKTLNQNFLTNHFYLNCILDFIKPEINTIYLEIGFGSGNLSKKILTKLFYYNFLIYFIEIEKFFFKNFFKFYKLNIINNNFLLFNLNIFKKFFFYNFKLLILGNIPYNITSFILFYLLKFKKYIICQYFLLEINYFKKIINSKSNLSLILKSFYRIKNNFSIDYFYFFPKPSVKSVFSEFKTLYLPLINLNDLYFFKKFLNFFFKRKRELNNYIILYYKFKNKFLKFKYF